MRILHIGAGDLSSGAGRGLYNLHLALLSASIESKILCQLEPQKPLVQVFTISNTRIKKIKRFAFTQLEKLPLLFYPKRSHELFSCSLLGFDITKNEWYEWADIIHFHWINQGMVSINLIQKIKKPLVWTMRDMWAFTGGCHYSFNCQKFISGCGHCPQLNSMRDSDLSRDNYKRKIKWIKNVHFTAISPWLTQLAEESRLFKQNQLVCKSIFNIVDTASFEFEIAKVENLRSAVPTGKKILLMGATNIQSTYKGYENVKNIFRLMGPNYHWFFFGGYELNDEFLLKNQNYTHFGYINDDRKLASIYASSDVFVAPSIAEAFGKTIIEAQACGTPVVCFDSTGPKYLVQHKVTGYKAIPYDVQDLINGINFTLESNLKQNNAEAIRNFAESFGKERAVTDYIDFYRSIIL